MDELDGILIRATEAVLIITALKEFILRLESDRNEKNAVTTDATIAFTRLVIQKYYKLSKTPVRKGVDGKLFPIIHDKN